MRTFYSTVKATPNLYLILRWTLAVVGILFLSLPPAKAVVPAPILLTPPNNYPWGILLPPILGWRPIEDPAINPNYLYEVYTCAGVGCLPIFTDTVTAGVCNSSVCPYSFAGALPNTTHRWNIVAVDLTTLESSPPSGTWQFFTNDVLDPDYITEKLVIDPIICVGESANVNVAVTNTGFDATASSNANVTENGVEYCRDANGTPPLVQNGSDNFSCTWVPNAAGTYVVEACADIDDAILESDEGNNCSSTSMVISDIPSGVTGLTSIIATENSITWSWDTLPGAISYDILIDGSFVMNQIGTTYTATGFSCGKNHTIEVRANNGCGRGLGVIHVASTSVCPQPDLVVTSISAATPVCAGQVVSVTSTTRNQGTSAAGSSTTRMSLGGATCDLAVGTLAVDAKQTLSCTLDPILSGIQAMTGEADLFNTIPNEIDEGNNSLSSAVLISSLPGLITGLVGTTQTNSTITWDWNDLAGANQYDYRLVNDLLWQTTTVSYATISGLVCGTSYDIEVRPSNSCGVGTVVTSNANTGACESITVTATPSSQSINQGSTASYIVDVTSNNGITDENVSFILGGCPSGGTTCTYVPASCFLTASGSCSVSLDIANTTATPVGNYTITITGITDILGLTDSTTVTLGASLVPAFCGDGNVDPGESCDGVNLNGEACTSLGFDGGTLVCTLSCTLDTSGCTTTPVEPELIGDLNCDDVVDIKDLGIMLSTSWWGGYTGGYNHPNCNVIPLPPPPL